MRSLSPGRETPLRTSARNVKGPKNSESSASALRWVSTQSAAKGSAAHSVTLVRLVARLGASIGFGERSVISWMSNGASLRSFPSEARQCGF